uniref:Uncharacterized protein n=1 Tax=Eutreptiella gymnastica TaxID=73025 RepID=A0A7S4CEV3_9EUGL
MGGDTLRFNPFIATPPHQPPQITTEDPRTHSRNYSALFLTWGQPVFMSSQVLTTSEHAPLEHLANIDNLPLCTCSAWGPHSVVIPQHMLGDSLAHFEQCPKSVLHVTSQHRVCWV